jgi:outer membrane lipoprotein SlyB
MKNRTWILGVALALPLSTFVAACGSDRGTDDQRAALEREALERDLNLALQPDTTAQPELADVPAPIIDEPAPAPVRPAPQPRQTSPRPSPQPSTPAPAPAAPSGPRTVTLSVPSGTQMAVRLNQELSTRTATAGTAFTGTLAEAVVASDGRTLIPAGATVRGRVTESKASERAGQTATITLAFESVAFGGRTYPISSRVVDVPVRTVTRDSKTEQAAKVGAGAAAGAVLGRVIGGNTKSTIAGAAVGAAAGTAVAMGTADVDAVIPAGSRVVIQLESPVQVTHTVS